ncbi:hypothetical protein FHG12_01795 [Hymenobacter jejuensis]|uniref:Macroglobulin domain-containing protein n=2 Tax=Hymenobacter jejuensis TaxID=2502781 RepID=A0A5B7ZVS3_9BACT|nr:hypothetical protein FHG12_01795 [Hymenobacter jejuensis]
MICKYKTMPSHKKTTWFFKVIIFFLCGSFSFVSAFGQTDSVKNINQQFARYNRRVVQEKLFLHLDRTYYVVGDIAWFKVYATDGVSHKPLPMSKIAYVEVLDNDKHAVLQGKITLRNATGQGSFQLPISLVSGNYTVRAYTNWMKNFSPEFYYQSTITIINTQGNAGLKSGVDSVAHDAQFFPEGGNLVEDITSQIAFKIVDRFGKGVDAEGFVLDQQGKKVAQFKSLKFGLGRFAFTPSGANAGYTAVIKIANKQVLTRKLPAAYKEGCVMRLEEINSEQLKISVQAKGISSAEEVFLLGHVGSKVAVSANVRLMNNSGSYLLNKKELPEGISHFTLFNAQKKPLCERLYFKRPAQRLLITAQTDKPQYAPRDKVSLQLATTNLTMQGVPANMSLAVYRLDSLATATYPNINSYLWLTSDLKGAIESPDYYLTSTGTEADEALDNLMLTHGWSRFRWEDVLTNQAVPFENPPELNGHFVRGRVTHSATGAAALDITTYLTAPGRYIRLYNSKSKSNGQIQFELKDFYGSQELVVQTDTQRDSTYHFELFSPFSAKYASPIPAQYRLSERFRTDITQRHLAAQVQNAYYKKYSTLYRVPALDSVPFYGKPSETYKLDDYTRFKVLEEVMREYVPGVQVRIRKDGFHFMVHDDPNRTVFYDNPMVLLDGVPVFNINKIMAMDPLKIQRLDVVTSRYFHGPLVYNGLVSYSTYKGDLDGFQLDPRALVQEYEGLQLQREFYAPRYETQQEKQSRRPDFRQLLYWNPEVVSAGSGNQTLSFYTSDQPGRYQVVIQGLAANGLAGSASFTFEVKGSL